MMVFWLTRLPPCVGTITFPWSNLSIPRRLSNYFETRMHSSRMLTARLLTVSPSMHCSRGVYLGGGCTWSGGVYLVLGDVTGPGGVYLVWGVYLPRGCTCQRGWGGGTWPDIVISYINFISMHYDTNLCLQQESIPVGCVTPTSVVTTRCQHLGCTF